METYELTVPIPSAKINKALILELEDYITKTMAKDAMVSGQVAITSSVDYKIKIRDKIGSEEFRSIKFTNGDKFPNDIKDISIGFFVSNSEENQANGARYFLLNMRLRFGRQNYDSDLNIEMSCDGAKRFSRSYMSEIQRIIESHKNYNYMFFNWPSWMAYAVLMAAALLSIKIPNMVLSAMAASFFLISAITTIFMRWVIPYSAFDTKANESKKGIIWWLIRGLAGNLLFTVILGAIIAYIRAHEA